MRTGALMGLAAGSAKLFNPWGAGREIPHTRARQIGQESVGTGGGEPADGQLAGFRTYVGRVVAVFTDTLPADVVG